MSSYQFAVEHTGRPFGPMETPTGWHEISRHTTLSAARKQVARFNREMREACGTGWDDHHRIVALRDTRICYTHRCSGWVGLADGRLYSCPNQCESTEELPWLAGRPAPVPTIPNGWESENQCAECANRE